MSGRDGRLTAVNVFDLSPADDPFTDLKTSHPLDWVRLTGLPRMLGRLPGPNWSRNRAAVQTARAARGDNRFVISHLPLMTAAVASAMPLLGAHAPHLAFAFNFTNLPQGRRATYMKRALAGIDRFAIFSHYERDLYARSLDLDPERLQPVIWTQNSPPVASGPRPRDGAYVCAIGGEGRDFTTLVDVARQLPGVHFEVVARPHSFEGLTVPANVNVSVNMPLAQVWRIAADSRGVLIPLKARDTCCGHVTIVSAKLLGLPQATTYSEATREYVDGRPGVLLSEPGDVTAYARLVEQLMDDHQSLRAAAKGQRAEEAKVHDRRHWAAFVDRFIDDVVLARA